MSLLGKHGRVAVACGFPDNGSKAFFIRARAKLAPSGVCRGRLNGYEIFRAWDYQKAANFAIRRLKPDALLFQYGRYDKFYNKVETRDIPVLVFLRMTNYKTYGMDAELISKAKNWRYFAVSDFVSQRFQDDFGIRPAVSGPLIRPEKVAVGSTGSKVLVVTTHAQKGGKHAVAVIESLSHFPFLVIAGRGKESSITQRLKALPNVEFITRLTDMREAYSKARLLLLCTGTGTGLKDPDPIYEAAGRVVTEAQISGIPCIVPKESGALERINGGGVGVSVHAPVSEWADAVSSLMCDEKLWQKMSGAARLSSAKAENHHEHVFARLLTSINTLISARS
ncbi:glycosyltransferase [Pacificimonas sp. ICDLI1SI03]